MVANAVFLEAWGFFSPVTRRWDFTLPLKSTSSLGQRHPSFVCYICHRSDCLYSGSTVKSKTAELRGECDPDHCDQALWQIDSAFLLVFLLQGGGVAYVFNCAS